MSEKMENKKKIRKIFGYAAILLGVPAVIGIGVALFTDRQYRIISVAVAVLSCVPFFLRLERGKYGARELTVIAVMTALSVLGRTVFYPIPGFKPVTAVTMIAGIAFGAEAGFLTGSLSALVSNMIFGQGPWTPFQMFSWGLIGFLSGLIFFEKTKPNRIVLAIAGAVSGALFSMLMDIWTTLSATGEFVLSAYGANLISSARFMAIYAVSNVIFLLLLAHPLLRKAERMKVKYHIFS